MGEGGGFFSPIDLYMWDRGYGQDKFRMAVEELAEKYGVQELSDDEIAEQNLSLASKLANYGYLLFSHKSESEAWATICMDSTMAENVDECNGRSGKSFYVNAIAKMAKTFKIDAGTTSFKDPRFIFDGVPMISSVRTADISTAS